MKRPPKAVSKPRSRKVWARSDNWAPISRDEALALRKATKNKTAAACFDSELEYRRWHELLLLERAGVIARLERQVSIPIVVDGVHVFSIEPDFVYFQDGRRIYDDTKGRKSGFEYRIFCIKWKVAKAKFPNAEWRVNGQAWEGK